LQDDAARLVEDLDDLDGSHPTQSVLWDDDDDVPQLLRPEDGSDVDQKPDGGSAEVWRRIAERQMLSEKSPDISRALYMLSKHANLTDVGFTNMIDVEDDRGKRPLDWALDEGNVRVLRSLLGQGASINDFRMLEKAHADRYSLNSGVVECLRVILDARPALQLDGADASALFSQAAHYENYGLIRLLLRREAQLEGASFISYRALLKVVENGEMDLVELILKRAANPVHDDPGPPMIWVASFLGHTKMVKVLHGLGANINVSCYGLGTILGTPMAAAASSGKLDTMKILISLGAKVNIVCSRLGTAFDIATALGRTEVLEYLIQQGGSSCGSKSMLTTEIYNLTFSKVAAGTG
jgi:ankyrin repeat protein